MTAAVPANRFAFVPMANFHGPWSALGALLKRPGSIIYELHHARTGRLIAALLGAALICLAIDGISIGSFSGGTQWWAAPAKLIAGSFLSALICLPSLYIFTCLSGAEIQLRPLSGALVGTICLNALLLLGFAPVVWVFGQSTESVAFMGTLHLIFWTVSMLFALRLLSAYLTFVGGAERGYLRLWCIIFIMVCFQMTTALRPFVGRSSRLLPNEKLFFLANWSQSMGGDAK